MRNCWNAPSGAAAEGEGDADAGVALQPWAQQDEAAGAEPGVGRGDGDVDMPRLEPASRWESQVTRTTVTLRPFTTRAGGSPLRVRKPAHRRRRYGAVRRFKVGAQKGNR